MYWLVINNKLGLQATKPPPSRCTLNDAQARDWLLGNKGGNKASNGMTTQHDQQYGSWRQSLVAVRRAKDHSTINWDGKVKLSNSQETAEAAKEQGRCGVEALTTSEKARQDMFTNEL